MAGLSLLEVDFDRERSFLKNILKAEKTRLMAEEDGRGDLARVEMPSQ